MSKLLPPFGWRCFHPEALPLDPRCAWISSFKELTRQGERDSHVSVMDSWLPGIKFVSSDLALESRLSGSKEPRRGAGVRSTGHRKRKQQKRARLVLMLRLPMPLLSQHVCPLRLCGLERPGGSQRGAGVRYDLCPVFVCVCLPASQRLVNLWKACPPSLWRINPAWKGFRAPLGSLKGIRRRQP
jgi:hypothetical protein